MRALWLALAASLLCLGCHSYHIDTVVQNRTGAAIQLLEVSYPSASFGADSVPSGGDFHYRIQLRGIGPLRVQYTAGASRQGQLVQIEGPTVSERQEGQIEVVLMPGGKADFHLHLSPRR